MHLTCWFFCTSLKCRNGQLLKLGMEKGELHGINCMFFHYSKFLIDSLLSVLYVLAYYLTSAFVLSNLPFRSFVPLPFINCVTGTQLKPWSCWHMPCASLPLFPCSHIWISLTPASHTVPGYLYAACPSKHNSKASFFREVPLIISVGKSLTFLWTSRGSHMALIIFCFVLHKCLLYLRDEIQCFGIEFVSFCAFYMVSCIMCSGWMEEWNDKKKKIFFFSSWYFSC